MFEGTHLAGVERNGEDDPADLGWREDRRDDQPINALTGLDHRIAAVVGKVGWDLRDGGAEFRRTIAEHFTGRIDYKGVRYIGTFAQIADRGFDRWAVAARDCG